MIPYLPGYTRITMSAQSRLCEVCSKPVSPGATAVKVGACEFPFWLHEECAPQISSVAGFIEEACALAETQPDGLLWMGSWDSADPGVREERGSV